MHMSDVLLSPAVAGVMYAGSVAATGYSIYKVKKIDQPESVPVMGVMGAFVFAAQMINFTIPGTGSSGHLCGGMMLSAILGPEAGFLTMIGVLLIQCLLFADGGLLALGANIWNMAFYGCFVGGYLIWKAIMKHGMSKKKITAASVLGCILTLQLGAFSVTLETLASDITELPFAAFVGVMQPIHLAIGLVEGLITAAVLVFIYEMRPELLWDGRRLRGSECVQKGRMSAKKMLIVFLVAAGLLGGVCSLFASELPDGLEWSMERIAGTAEPGGLAGTAEPGGLAGTAEPGEITDTTESEQTGAVYEVSNSIQEASAILPDYSLKGNDTPVGTSLSGILGGAVVIAFYTVLCYVLKLFRKKTGNESLE